SAYHMIAQLRQHITPNDRVHGIINYGGAAPNIVPDRAEATYYIRSPEVATLASLKDRVRACLEAGAAGAGATVELEWWEHSYLNLRTNQPLARAYRTNAESLGRSFFELANIPPSAGGAPDMGNVSHLVPSIHPTVAIAPIG